MDDAKAKALRERLTQLRDDLEGPRSVAVDRLYWGCEWMALALAPKADAWRLWQNAIDLWKVADDDHEDDERSLVGRYLCLTSALGALLAEVPDGTEGEFAERIALHDEIVAEAKGAARLRA